MKMTYYQVFRKAAERIAEDGGWSCIAVDAVAQAYKSGPRRYYEQFFLDCGRDQMVPMQYNSANHKNPVFPKASRVEGHKVRNMRVLLLLLVAEEVRGKCLYEEVD